MKEKPEAWLLCDRIAILFSVFTRTGKRRRPLPTAEADSTKMSFLTKGGNWRDHVKY